jgi:hypothetical protein
MQSYHLGPFRQMSENILECITIGYNGGALAESRIF